MYDLWVYAAVCNNECTMWIRVDGRWTLLKHYRVYIIILIIITIILITVWYLLHLPILLLQANWYKAAQYCRFHGMHLASLSSQEDNDRLEKHVNDFGKFGFHLIVLNFILPFSYFYCFTVIGC